jgi:hypothetical protein
LRGRRLAGLQRLPNHETIESEASRRQRQKQRHDPAFAPPRCCLTQRQANAAQSGVSRFQWLQLPSAKPTGFRKMMPS